MPTSTYEGWAILELMGHRERPGYVKEVELAGGKLVRIDIPVSKDEADNDITVTEFYGAGAIYCLTPCTEEIARNGVTPYNDPRPVRPMEYRERRRLTRDVEAGEEETQGKDEELSF